MTKNSYTRSADNFRVKKAVMRQNYFGTRHKICLKLKILFSKCQPLLVCNNMPRTDPSIMKT